MLIIKTLDSRWRKRCWEWGWQWAFY